MSPLMMNGCVWQWSKPGDGTAGAYALPYRNLLPHNQQSVAAWLLSSRFRWLLQLNRGHIDRTSATWAPCEAGLFSDEISPQELACGDVRPLI